MANGVMIWWILLCAVACANVGAWLHARQWLKRRAAHFHPVVFRHRRWLLWLSGVYVFVCAFRSFFPRVDVERIVLVDSWLSSILIGRTAATIAEVCFGVELCLLIYWIGKTVDSRWGARMALVPVPLLVIAEACSWYAVLIANNGWHVVENSLWTVAAALMVLALLAIRPRAYATLRTVLTGGILTGIAYILYMTTVNLPEYVSRWQDGIASGHAYLSPGQGLTELLHVWTVTFDWNAWHLDIGWQTLYFSTAVWLSIGLVYTPPFETTDSRAERQG